MLQSINIKGFRKYKNITIDNFGQINFILGNNNIGKTSILEAIYAWACGQNIVPILNIPLSRGRYYSIQNPYWILEELLAMVNEHKNLPFSVSFTGKFDDIEECFEHKIYPSELLSDYDSSYKRINQTIPNNSEDMINDNPSIAPTQIGMFQFAQSKFVAKWEVKHNDSICSENITVPMTMVSKTKPFCFAKFIDVLSHIGVVETVQMYSSLKRERLIDNVAYEMRKVFPEISGFDMIPYPDGSQTPISVVKNDGSMLPLYAYGDGIQRWFYILGAIALYKNSIICIDEIDVGFHPGAQYEFGKNLAEYAKDNGVQLFITTHNIEYVDHFLDSMEKLGNGFIDMTRIITLREMEGETKIRSMTGKDAIKARQDYGVELR